MTTFAEILAFVKGLARVADTSQDTVFGMQINASYRKYWRRLQSLGHSNQRATDTFNTATDTQDYDLPDDFDRLIDESVQYQVYPGVPQYGKTLIPIVSGPDAELWEAVPTSYYPQACRIIAGTDGAQKLRLMPSFTQVGNTVEFAYYKRPPELSGSDDLEIPALADAVAYDVLAQNVDYTRDGNASNSQINYLARAKTAFNEVLGTLTV